MKKVIFKFRWLKNKKLNCFTEMGIDPDNNKLLGISTELEDEQGNDLCRVPGFVKMKAKEFYFRIWLFKYCFSFGTGEMVLEKKDRLNFKLLFGIAGENKKEVNKMLEKNKMKINFCISKHCFLNCLGCYNNFSQNKDIKFHKIKKFLKYIRLNGIERITLSGGDPLARKDMLKLIKTILKMGFTLNLDTVGTPFITKCQVVNANKIKYISRIKNFDLFKKIDLIGVPLDGSNNDVVSQFRQGRADLFDEQIGIIEKLEEQGIKICINTVLHKGNSKDIVKMFKILKQHKNIIKWEIFQFMPIGPKGSANAKKFFISDDEFFKIKDKLMKQFNNEFEIVFKGGKIRSHNYMLINSSGDAYKVDLDNKREDFGNIGNKKEWDNIIENL